jgi:lipopolysaccharide export system protein LptA
VSAFSAKAEKADREKPTQVEANRMTSDEARRISIFEGNVVLSKGTMQLRAERVVVRQDADGFQFATATGDPVRFRQKSDPRGGQEGAWIEAEAARVEIDERSERVELFESARVTRDKDVLRGRALVRTDREVRFTERGRTLVGLGMEYDNEARRLELQARVRGVFEAEVQQ